MLSRIQINEESSLLAVKSRLLNSNINLFLLINLIAAAVIGSLNRVWSFETGLLWAGMTLISCLILFILTTLHKRAAAESVGSWRIYFLPGVMMMSLCWGFAIDFLVREPSTGTITLSLILASLLVLVSILLLTVDLINASLYLLVMVITLVSYTQVQNHEISEGLVVVFVTCFIALIIITIWMLGIRQRYLLLSANRALLKNRLEDAEEALASVNEELNTKDGQRQYVEHELSLAKEAADSANMAKTEFLATMSHEIRTPLNGILPILEMLQDTHLSGEQQQLVNTALNSSQLLLGIINDILDFSKVEAGKLELESIETNVRELVESVASLMKNAAKRRGLQLNYTIATDVPPVVRGDPIRLRQILSNLVSNAIKFTDSGKIDVEVSQRGTTRTEVELLFAVRDTGMGMSEAVTSRIFDAFSQADASTTRTHGGSGLGLVICKRLTELMGGRIGVKSEENKGSVFWFVVPLRRSLQDVPSARRDLHGARVLVVSPDDNDYSTLRRFMDEWGILHERAEDRNDALVKLKTSLNLGDSWIYELVILDEGVAGLNAHKFLREMNKLKPLREVKRLILNASHQLKKNLKSMPVEFIETPIERVDLLNKLNRLLDVEASHVSNSNEVFTQVHRLPDEQHSWDDLKSFNSLSFEDSFHKQPVRTEPPPLLNGRVLLVEDNPINLAVIDRIMTKLGIDTVSAVDGIKALSEVEKGRFDLVMMDCQMPRLDGYETTKAIRNREYSENLPHLPIIAMTANAMAGDRERCLEAGMDDYIAKPVKSSSIRNILQQWLPEKQSTADGIRSEITPAITPPHLLFEEDETELAPEELLDQTVIDELFEIMEEESIRLIQNYLINSKSLMRDIKSAIKLCDLKALATPAHSLKSSSANVGATAVSTLAKNLEHKARKNVSSGLKMDYQEISLCYKATVKALKTLCKHKTA